MTTTSTTKRNQLTNKQSFQLANWCTANVQRIQRHTHSDIAALAESDLGFKINSNNVSTALDVSGVNVGKPKLNRRGGNQTNRTVIVAQELKALLEQLGHPISERLEYVASNSRNSRKGSPE